jgi:hypothetical protein
MSICTAATFILATSYKPALFMAVAETGKLNNR